jgi:large subunit ribosomal protein L21
MYAVIETGGKQYRVELGAEIEIDRLDAAPGETIELGRVLLLADGDDAQIGRPVVDGVRVSASVVRQDRADKVIVFKYKQKTRRRVKRGHRQDLTRVRIADIEFNGRSAAAEAEIKAIQQDVARRAEEEEATRKAAADRALAEKLERDEQAVREAAAETEGEATAKPRRGRRTATNEADAGKAETGKTKARAADKTGAEATRRRSRSAKSDADDTGKKSPEAKRPRSKKDE